MNKHIPGRFENEGVIAYECFISHREAKAIAMRTRRIRYGAFSPHYGKQAAARNLRHREAGTHGL